MRTLPQVARNVPVGAAAREVVGRVETVAEQVRRRLEPDGRLVLRPSGTEPVVRVMVEAADSQEAEAAADEVVRALEAAGASPAG
jgi:phosphoglucosamine mutase